MKKNLIKVAMVIGSICLVGCTNMTKEDVGTVSGGVIGGLIGSQFGGGSGQILATGVGVLAGAMIGNSIGKNMDDTDRMRMCYAFEHNGSGVPAYWQNCRTGTSYTVIPTENVTIRGNPYCREYRSTAIIGGRKQQVYGTACRQQDGSWQIVS